MTQYLTFEFEDIDEDMLPAAGVAVLSVLDSDGDELIFTGHLENVNPKESQAVGLFLFGFEDAQDQLMGRNGYSRGEDDDSE